MKFRYSGPLSGVTLADGQEVMLHPDAEVELPEDNEYVRTLQALEHLTPVLPATKAAKAAKGE
jgi:hypothetical protein